jgi:hypothetical protein
MSRSPLRALACAAVAWALASCASLPPPKAEMADAETALRAAEQVNAADQAPLEMRLAREKLEGARAALRDGDHLEARRLAEEAAVDAQVAEMKARNASAQAVAEAIRADIEAIREEAGRAAGNVR